MMEDDNSSHKQYTECHDGIGSEVRYMSIFLYPVWKHIEKYLNYNDIFNLRLTNVYARMSIYSLCTELRLSNPNYYRGPKVGDSESPEFIINKFTNITSLSLTPSAMKLDFLKNKNLNNLRQISIPSKYFSVARQSLPMSLRDLQIYEFSMPDESYQAVFDNTEAFKQLQKLDIISVYINDKSLTYLPETLEHLSLSIPDISKNYKYNFNIAHLVNLKELHCTLFNCHTIKLPSNLEKMYLRGFSEMNGNELDISYLNNLKIFELKECSITNIILPLSLEDLKITFCHYLTRLNISKLINLKQMDCNINMGLSKIYLPGDNLEKLRMSNCGGIKKIKISHLLKLNTLVLHFMVKLKSLVLPPSLRDIYIKDCNIRIINEREIKFDFERPRKLYSHTIKIRERWELIDYEVST